VFDNFQRNPLYELGIEITNKVEENNALLSLIEKETVHTTHSEEVSTLEDPPIEEIIDEGSPFPFEIQSLGQHVQEESFHKDTQPYEEDVDRNFEHENDQFVFLIHTKLRT
jgi:hypothetical protein